MLDRTIAPKTRTFEHLAIPAESVETLPGGVTLHVLNNGKLPMNRICVLWNYGSSMSAAEGCAAVAGFVPELIREGSASISGADLAEAIDYNGAWIRSRSGEHYSIIDLVSLNHTTSDLLAMLADVFCNATLPEKAFEAIRTSCVRRRQLQLSKVSVLSQEASSRLISGHNHPYFNNDTIEQIEGITYDDVVKAYKTGTQRCKIHVYASGQIDDNLLQAIRSFCNTLRSEAVEPYTFANVAIKPEPVQWQHIEVPGSLQDSLSASIPTIINREHPDYINLRLAVIALGGYFGSRLMSNIREEKGLTYGISASLLGMREGAYAQINAQYAAGNSQQVIDEVRHELNVLANEPMPDDELTRLKRFVTSNLAATLDSPFAISDYYQNQVLVGTPSNYFDEQFRCTTQLSAETIMRVTREYLKPEEMRIATAGSPI